MSQNRLQTINLTSFVGGLNLRRNQFQLAEDESPDMLNVDVDPRGGFYTRKGWNRWNTADFTTTPWKPRNAYLHLVPNGNQVVYVCEDGTVWRGNDAGTFAATGIVASASPHIADFASWGADTYVACGKASASKKIGSTGTVTTLGATFSEVDSPVPNQMPQSEFVESHIGYLFVAGTRESGTDYASRIRWSHPNRPDSWRADDYLDIEAGGGRITAIVSFQDHLLIFKSASIWALYGYNDDSWQLVRVSSSIGAPALTAVTKSETACYFYSSSNGGGIYAYAGNPPVYISEKIRSAFEEIISFEQVYVSFAGRRLWVAVPWLAGSGDMVEPTTLFVFDIDTGAGAWTAYGSTRGGVATVLDGAAAGVKFPLACFWSDEAVAMVTLDSIDDAYDTIVYDGPSLVQDAFGAYYRTRWLNGGAPELRKSWRRPRMIVRRSTAEAQILVESYVDYNQSTLVRSRTLDIPASPSATWDSFDWGDGTDWGATVSGGQLMRGPDLGHSAALQLKLSAGPAGRKAKWGVDGIIMKVNTMRLRT